MKIPTISLFSGAGGLDSGFKDADFDIRVAVEIDPSCCDTLRKNFPNTEVIEESIIDLTVASVLEIAELEPGDDFCIIGGPPCQSFSLAGKRGGMDDPRGQLLKHYIRFVREARPTAFLMENVKGLVNWSGGKALDWIIQQLESPIDTEADSYKYVCNYEVLNAANYGVPQIRERFFLIGNRIGIDFEFPDSTHTNNLSDRDKELKPWMTVWDAIGKLPDADEPSPVAKRVAGTIKKRISKHGY